MAFELVKMPNGKRALLNMDLVFGYEEGPNGEAVAIALTGLTMTLGESFDDFIATLDPIEEDPEDPPADDNATG